MIGRVVRLSDGPFFLCRLFPCFVFMFSEIGFAKLENRRPISHHSLLKTSENRREKQKHSLKALKRSDVLG